MRILMTGERYERCKPRFNFIQVDINNENESEANLNEVKEFAEKL